MIDTIDATARLDEISAEIDRLYTEQHKIQMELRQQENAEHLARFETWGIQQGSCLLMFAKSSRGFHWTICKVVKIMEVSNKYGQPALLDSIVTSYCEADYDYFLRTEASQSSIEILKNYEEEFNVYIVDEEHRSRLLSYMNDLKLTYDNYKTYEEEFAKAAKMTIKI